MVLPLLPTFTKPTLAANQRTGPGYCCYPPTKSARACYETWTPQQPDRTTDMESSRHNQVVGDKGSRTQIPGIQGEAHVPVEGNPGSMSSSMSPHQQVPEAFPPHQEGRIVRREAVQIDCMTPPQHIPSNFQSLLVYGQGVLMILSPEMKNEWLLELHGPLQLLLEVCLLLRHVRDGAIQTTLPNPVTGTWLHPGMHLLRGYGPIC